MTKPLWTPNDKVIKESNIIKYQNFLKQNYNQSFDDFFELYDWSIADSATFWDAILHFFEVIVHEKRHEIIENKEDMFNARWFPGVKLNFAENLLKFRDNHQALIFYGEDKTQATYTYAEIYTLVAQLASALRAQGITKGDRVAGMMPNIPETIIAMLATTSIGAVWSSTSPDFGAQSIIDRFEQIQPKVLFACESYYYKGQTIDCTMTLKALENKLTTVEKIVLAPYIEKNTNNHLSSKTIIWSDFLDKSTDTILFTPVDFNDPLYILFSSGTTGKPKCIVHGVGGTLLQHLKELSLHTDLKRDDKFFFYTTCGWMMWNWMVSGLALGATLVLYDGNPLYPNSARLLDLVDEIGITIFGTSAKYLASLEHEGLIPKKSHQLTTLKAILSTGSPLLAEQFEYIYRDVKADVRLSSISGGTDIVSCFALGCPILPVYKGQLQTPGLGMAIAFYDEKGKPVMHKKGELVCEKPFPSMPIYFWGDTERKKYHAAYFEKYPHVWAHGDFGQSTKERGVIIYGRSDTTLNPGGVRIGSAEIYRQVEKINAIEESVVVGQAWKNDERIILFVKLRDNADFNADLVRIINETIRKNTTHRHVPAKIIPVEDIPKTRNNKISEVAVQSAINGRDVKNKNALLNPESLRYFSNLEALEKD